MILSPGARRHHIDLKSSLIFFMYYAVLVNNIRLVLVPVYCLNHGQSSSSTKLGVWSSGRGDCVNISLDDMQQDIRYPA